MPQRHLSKPIEINGRKCCPNCGSSYLRRVPRTTFKQRTILSFIGIYPWECGQCKEPFLIKKRYGRPSTPQYPD